MDAARIYRNGVREQLKRLGGGDDIYSRQYYNYALMKGLSDALDHYRMQTLIEDYLNLFGKAPSSAEANIIASAIARVHLDPRLKGALKDLARRHERVIRFLSHASVIDPRPISAVSLAIDQLNRHGSVKAIPDEKMRDIATYVLNDLNDVATPSDLLIHTWKEFSDKMEGMIVNYQRILAILRAEQTLRSEMGKDNLSANLQRMLGELGEDSASSFTGTVIKHFNRAIYDLEGKIYHNHGPAHVYYNRVEPALRAYRAAFSALTGQVMDISEAEEDLDAYRRAFVERVNLPDDHEHALLLDSALHAFMMAYGDNGRRIYFELAKIHGKDPLNVLGEGNEKDK